MFERYYHELLSFIARSPSNRAHARDIIQETFARALTQQTVAVAGGKPAVPAEPRALLFHTTKNIVNDQHRRTLVIWQKSARRAIRGSAETTMLCHASPTGIDRLNAKSPRRAGFDYSNVDSGFLAFG